MPSTPVSTARRASSRWQRVWVSSFVLSPNPAMREQSARLCGLAAGEVNSRYSTPKASNSRAISSFCPLSKKALANCSPSRNVDSIIEKCSKLILALPPISMAIKKPVHPVWNGRWLRLQHLSRRKQQTGQSGFRFLLFMQCNSGYILYILIHLLANCRD